MSFQNTRRQDLELYGRCVVQQQKTIKDFDAIRIIGMTREEHDNTKDQLLALPGIREMNVSREIHSKGRWNVLTDATVPATTLTEFDKIVSKIKKSMYRSPDNPPNPQRLIKKTKYFYGIQEQVVDQNKERNETICTYPN